MKNRKPLAHDVFETFATKADPVCDVTDTKWQRTRTCFHIVQELCESQGGRPGLSVLTSLLVSVDVKLY